MKAETVPIILVHHYVPSVLPVPDIKLVLNEYLLTKGRKKENSYTSESRNMEEEKKRSRVQIFTKRITRGHSCKAKTSSPSLNSNSSKSYPYTQFSSN